MTTPPSTITTAADLDALWRFVDGGHGYDGARVYAVLVEAGGAVVPQIIQIDDDCTDLEPDDELVGNLVRILAEVVPGATVALMRARPGRQPMTALDERWCRALHQHATAAPFHAHSLYFATDESVGPVPADVLIEPAA